MTQLQLQYQQNKLKEQEVAETARANREQERLKGKQVHVEEFLAPYKAADLVRSANERQASQFQKVAKGLTDIIGTGVKSGSLLGG